MVSNRVHNLITIHPLVCKLQYTGGYKQQTKSPLYYAHCAQSAQIWIPLCLAQSRHSEDTVFVQCIGTMKVLFVLNDWVTK
jgi:hypothetical protein